MGAVNGGTPAHEDATPANRASSLLIPRHGRHIRHGGEDGVQIGEAAPVGAFLDAIADLPDGDWEERAMAMMESTLVPSR